MDSEKIIFCERLLINNPRQRTEKNGRQIQLTVTELDCEYNLSTGSVTMVSIVYQ